MPDVMAKIRNMIVDAGDVVSVEYSLTSVASDSTLLYLKRLKI